jgi:outer membrane protein assembly factor BamB
VRALHSDQWRWLVLLPLLVPFSAPAAAQDSGSTADRPFIFFTPGLAIIDRDTDHDRFFNSIDTTLAIPFSEHTSAVGTYSLQFNDKPRWTAKGNYDWFVGPRTTLRLSAGMIDDEFGARAVAFQQRNRFGTGLRAGFVGGDFEVGGFVSMPLAWGFPLRKQSASDRLRGRNSVTDLGAATALSLSIRGGEADLGTEPLYFFPRDADWARFGQGPQGQGATAAALAPSLFPAWVAETGGPVRSSAAIADNTVYVGSDDGYLYALSLETGELRWSYRIGSRVASSPAVALGRIFVGADDGAVYCFDANADKRLSEQRIGRQLWRYRTGGAVVGSPLVTASGLVVVGSEDGALYALDAKSARLVWSYPTAGAITTSPVKSEAPLAVVSPQDSTTSKRDIVYCGSEDGSLYAFGERTGTLLWRVSTGAPIGSTPTVHARKVLVANQDGRVLALDGASGKEIWAQSLGGDVRGSLTIADDQTIVPQFSGRLTGLDLATGAPTWASELPGPIESTPAAVSGKSLFLGCMDGSLYSVNRRTGQVVWDAPTGAAITASPAAAHSMLVCGSHDGAVYAFSSRRPDDDRVVRHSYTPDKPAGAPVDEPSPPAEPTAVSQQPPPLVPLKPAWTPPPGWSGEPSTGKPGEAAEPADVPQQPGAQAQGREIEMRLVSEPADAAELPIQLVSTRETVVTWGTTSPSAEVDGEVVRNNAGQITVRKSFAADGTYPVTMVTNRDTPQEHMLCRLVIVDTREQPASARPVAFSPDGDGVGDTIALRAFAADGEGAPIAARVLEVREPSGEAVHTWSAPGGGESTFVWDGRDITGKPVRAGRYVLTYTARDEGGCIRRMVQPIILQRAGERMVAR